MTEMTLRRVLWALALVPFVGAAGPAEAGPIYTYTFTTDEDFKGGPISGSFQVDSSHIGASGNTDISPFITGLSFTSLSGPFTAPQFRPENVMVTPAGDLTGDVDSRFFGDGSKPGLSLSVNTQGMTGQD